MRIGLQIADWTWPGGGSQTASQLESIARQAELAGFSSLWVMDHFFQIPHLGPAEQPMLEAYTTLGFLAAVTHRIELGVLVTGVTYRPPGLLAKIVTTLDVLSRGRAWVGLGAAWFEREHRGLGWDFPPLGERFERLEETLQVLLQMWSEDNGPFHGRHYRLAETVCAPLPVQRPHPPLLIGGMGPRRTLALVARYAQACNFLEHLGLELLQQRLAVLRQHCERCGRPESEIEKTVLGQTRLPDRQAAQKLLAKLERLAELGFQQAIYAFKDPLDRKTLELFAEVIIPEAARRLGPPPGRSSG